MDVGTCIEWDGRINADGYGMKGRVLAHRHAWREANGDIHAGMVIHHDCLNKRCVNIAHLRCISHAEHNKLHLNAQPMYERRRAITHCPRGHKYTPENTLVKRGKRHCRKCENARSLDYYARNRERLMARMRERAKERYWERKNAVNRAWVRGE